MKPPSSLRPFDPRVAFVLAFSLLSAPASAAAQDPAPARSADSVWQAVESSGTGARSATRGGQMYRLDPGQLGSVIGAAPLERAMRVEDSPTVVQLPLPSGGFARFRVVESNILAPSLAARYPEIKSYSGQGIDDPAATVRFGWSPTGVSGLIVGPNYTVTLTPADPTDAALHRSGFGVGTTDFSCGVKPGAQSAARSIALRSEARTSVGSQLRTYRSPFILNNANVPPAKTGDDFTAEILPAISRALNFRVTVRDNRASGAALADDQVTLTVDGNERGRDHRLGTGPNRSQRGRAADLS